MLGLSSFQYIDQNFAASYCVKMCTLDFLSFSLVDWVRERRVKSLISSGYAYLPLRRMPEPTTVSCTALIFISEIFLVVLQLRIWRTEYFFFFFLQLFSVSLSLPWFPRKSLQDGICLFYRHCKMGSVFCQCLNVMNTEGKYLVILNLPFS